MALTEITQLSTQEEYKTINQEYITLKNHILECIQFEEFEVLTSYDITKIRELHFQRSALYWKLKVQKVQNRMDEIKRTNKNYQHDIEYCRLVIRKFNHYAEQKKAELKAKGDATSYNRIHKPVIENKILEWELRLENSKKIRKMETSHEKIKVIP